MNEPLPVEIKIFTDEMEKHMLKQNTKLKNKNQNLEKNAVTWSRNTLHKITLLVFPNTKLKSKML